MEIDDDQMDGKNSQQTSKEEENRQAEIAMQYIEKPREPSYPGEPMVSVWESSSDEDDIMEGKQLIRNKDAACDLGNASACRSRSFLLSSNWC